MLRAAIALTLVLSVCVAATAQGQQAPAVPDCARAVAGLDLQTATIPQLQAAMAADRLTSARLVDAYLARIAAYDGQLLSIRQLSPHARGDAEALDAERARGNLRGPLHGIPVLLKDNVATADLATTAGSIALAGVVPVRDATITQRLRAAGAVILGKANLSEFAGWVDLDARPGWSSLGGQVKNAYNLAASPSGSSSGSAVAASMAFAAATIGTETSGSILSPSDANSAVGVKTTLGIASRAGILPLSPSFDVPGPIVRNVTDAALVLGAIAGADPRDAATAGAQLPPGGDFTAALKPGALEGVTLAYSQSTRDGLGAGRRALFDAGLERLAKLGATVNAVDSFDSESVGLTEIATIPNEFKASLNEFLASEMPNAPVQTLSDIVANANAHPEAYPYGHDLLDASDATPGSSALYPVGSAGVRRAAQGSIEGALAEGDAEAIVTPGNAHANIGAAAGYPTVIVPLGYTAEGSSPFGIGFLGRAYSEPRLLGFAHAFEQDARARVPPTDVNAELRPAACPPPEVAGGAPAPSTAPGGIPATPPALLPRLRVTLARRGRALRITVRGAIARRVTVIVRRGRRVIARRTVAARAGTARLRVRLRRRGTYRATVLDPGPPARAVSTKRLRVRRV